MPILGLDFTYLERLGYHSVGIGGDVKALTEGVIQFVVALIVESLTLILNGLRMFSNGDDGSHRSFKGNLDVNVCISSPKGRGGA